jgi:hypothetical protein
MGLLFAIAGGSVPVTLVIHFFGLCVILPCVVFFILYAFVHKSCWAAIVPVVLTVLPLLNLISLTADFQPSDDREVLEDQLECYSMLRIYAVLAILAGLSLANTIVRLSRTKWDALGYDVAMVERAQKPPSEYSKLSFLLPMSCVVAIFLGILLLKYIR